MKAKYSVKNEVAVNYSEPTGEKTKQKPVTIEEKPPPKQLLATELLQQHSQAWKAKQQEKIEKKG